MLFVFPSGTDAPLYHPPYATLGLIGLNLVVFVCQLLVPGINDSLMLIHGTINPIQWVASTVMHGGIFHLIGNMVIFAVFSWIIEGKVGWWRTILIYFGVGALANGFEQLLFLFLPSPVDGSLGASGVIYGFFAIALLWAPENNVSLTYFGLFFFYPVFGTFEVTISGFCFFMLAVESAVVWFSFFSMSSAVLHLFGAVPGFLVGYLMLRFRRVNCDGYDMISIWQGKQGQGTLTVAEEKADQARKDDARQKLQQETQQGLQQVKNYLEQGQHLFALKRYQLLKKCNPSFVLPESVLLQLIRAFDKSSDQREKIVGLIEIYHKHYQRNRNPLILMLARYFVVDKESPRKALGHLKQLDQAQLSPREKKMFKALVEKARELIRQGVLEIGE